MGLDFLVMYFHDLVARTPGLGLVLTVLGSVLVFVQICLAIQMMLVGLHLAFCRAEGSSTPEGRLWCRRRLIRRRGVDRELAVARKL